MHRVSFLRTIFEHAFPVDHQDRKKLSVRGLEILRMELGTISDVIEDIAFSPDPEPPRLLSKKQGERAVAFFWR